MAACLLGLGAQQGAAAVKNPSGSTLRGFVVYDEKDNLLPGWYEFDTDGNMDMLWQWDSSLANSAFVPRGGWIRNGRLCMIVASSYSGDQQLAGFGYVEVDPATGKILENKDINPYNNQYANMISLAYVAKEDKVYGISQDPDSNSCYLVSAPADDISKASKIAKLSAPGYRAYSFAYSPEEECFYGIAYFDKLVRYDKDGTVTDVCNVPLSHLTSERGGMIYSPLDGCYIYSPTYNPSGYDAPFDLYAVDPAAKTFTQYVSKPDAVQIAFMLSPDTYELQDKSPAIPSVKSVDLISGDTDATVVYTLPAAAHDGSALNGSLSWTAKVDNVTFSSGTAGPGDDVTVNFTGLANGPRSLQLTLGSGDLISLPAVAKVFAGKDVPKTPANVFLTASKVTWEAVTQGTHGESIDHDNLSYKVYLNGEFQGSTSATEYALTLDDTTPMTAYTASVVAVAGDAESEPGYSNKIVFGRPFDLPMHFAPTEDDFDLMTVYNLDGGPEYGIWEYSERWDEPCFSSGWSLDKDADDWLILPGASFKDPSKAARLAFMAACGGTSDKEEFLEVWMGSSPEPDAMTIPILSKTQIRSNEWETYDNIFAVPEAGTYYIGFHSVSKPFQYSLIVRDINVTQTELDARAPRVVDNLEIKSTSDADLTATLSFTMPRFYLNGEQIPEHVSLTAKVSSEVDTQGFTGYPGDTVEGVIGTAQGNNIISVVASYGSAEGQKAEVQVFTGVDVPDFVENYNTSISEDNMTLHMTWEAPLKALYDGYFETTGLQYYVGELDSEGDFIGEPILVGTDVFEYDYTLPAGTPMASRYIAVAAGNAAGISPARWYAMATIGTPYTPPMVEEFENMTFKYEPITMSAPDQRYANGSWAWAQPELIDPAFDHGPGDYALAGYSTEGSANVRMNLPKFATAVQENPVVVFDLWNGTGRPSEVTVYASTFGIAPKKIASIPAGTGWENCKVTLPDEFIGRKWVTISIDGSLPDTEHYLIISGYSVANESGIMSIDDPENSVRYYTIDGIEVDEPQPGNLYIKVQGNTSTKIIAK